jgi:hypothetical protein
MRKLEEKNKKTLPERSRSSRMARRRRRMARRRMAPNLELQL